MGDKEDVWIVVPAYKEEAVIGLVLQNLMQTGYRVVVVDDGSNDNTAKEVLKYPVTLLRHCYNLGQGAALQTGISYALTFSTTKYIVTFDSDGQHQVQDIEKLLNPLRSGTHEVTLGSRFLEKNGTINLPLSKRIMLHLALAFSRFSTHLKLTDTHNGLRAFTTRAASKISIKQNRMAHASEILSQISDHKLKYCEIPVTIIYTDYSKAKGQSLLNSINIIWDLVRGNLK
ncbi:MAG: glycosyltransferase family 2 protein [Chloroflexi bacterium]|uniref:Glycosyltransferase family 2 protein n=1 Tax=Candidatus Chlorohelix allophototropha TaxID=3003348 RepID=A0A8T7M694_9CHLR|nr:glycosyltransferase family 2 protein [Chloroflexota bacterium]WJW69527.1 glycosyltransferase family 2 protein [Chloroflexota bacterium L227-S17]